MLQVKFFSMIITKPRCFEEKYTVFSAIHPGIFVNVIFLAYSA